MKYFLLPLFLAAFFGFGAMAQAADSPPKDGIPRHTEVSLIPEYMAVRPGESLYIAVDQKIEQGWHTYWKNPGDSGETTHVAWEGLDGLVVNDLEFPAPHKIDVGPLSNFGFSGHVRFLQRLDFPETLTGQTISLKARATWLVCEEICVPEEMEQSVTFNVIGFNNLSPPAVNEELFKETRAAIPPLVPWQGMIEEMEQTIILALRPDPDAAPKFAGAKDVYFYPEEWGIILNPPVQTITLEGDLVQIKMQRDTRPLSEIASLKGVLTYTTAKGQREAVALDVPLASSPAVASAASASPSPMTTPAQGDPLPLPEDHMTLGQALILALLGGVILNLMPCVFPVLSLKALSLVKMSAKEKTHAAMHGFIYTLGVLLCFGAIAGALISLKAAGEEIGWGFQMQNPTVVLLLAYLLFIMAANMSGFFEFKSGMLSNIGQNLTSHHGYSGTFFTGILAVLVATPCTAPFMGTALGFALTQPTFVAVSIFLSLGLGLALPYLVLCLVPPVRRLLPKPGVWMETFREFMAFPLYASVAWLIWVYAQQISGMYGVFSGLIGIVLIAFTIWIVRKSARHAAIKLLKYGLMLFAVFFALSIAILSNMKTMSGQTQPAEQANLPTTPYSPENLAKLLEQNEPVFVDMTAAWCITCKVNEQVALETEATRALFQDHQVRYVVGDWTNRDPAITKFLRDYGRSGVPLYVYYGPRDNVTQKRPEAIVLPQLLTSGLVADVVEGRVSN